MTPENLPNGLQVSTMLPLDAKLRFKTLDDMKDLGFNSSRAFIYYDKMIVFCSEDKKNYIWDVSSNYTEPGLLDDNFEYPSGIVVDDIDYSNVEYNFYLFGNEEPVWEDDLIVSLPDVAPGVPGSLGGFLNGDTIPTAGKKDKEIIQMLAQKPIPPTVTLTSPTVIEFNQQTIENVLNFSYVIESLGGSVASVKLEWRRESEIPWNELSTDDSITTFTHEFSGETAMNPKGFQYRYTVIDDFGASNSVQIQVTPKPYIAPTINLLAGSLVRERGNIETSVTGTVSRVSPLVNVLGYQVQYRVNNTGSWIDLDTYKVLGNNGGSILIPHDDSLLKNSNNLSYRAIVTDQKGSTTSSVVTVNFYHRNALGYSDSIALSLSDIALLPNSSFMDSKVRTINNVTAPSDEHTFYVYAASQPNLTEVTMNGSTPVLGSFTGPATVSGTNSYGASVSYKVYRTNSPGAFTNNKLDFE